MHFQDKHASIFITRVDEHKRAQIHVEEGVRLALEAINIAEEEEDHAWLETEEGARLVEEERLKDEEEEQDC